MNMDLLDLNTIRAAVTLVSMVVFLAIVGWAYARRNRQHFEELGSLALMGEEPDARGGRDE
ncbi:cbb3-type cytochrome oxidase subunit 3 [Roseateles amylovorans]|uniref:Cbb3-type cytochrome c oxidase subunit 3 n=1 Tax=Roseateles amylovorans TaxID=2978473 RepID=A0ABY6B5L9_9BURK|nr:cbb3-type cytochrome c oxidase subunit 3 [Roseateles amylovorans]UXH80051.1 cbb3-type cytochrome c oxidase subunit 3 [Roseateles amylovorans]